MRADLICPSKPLLREGFFYGKTTEDCANVINRGEETGILGWVTWGRQKKTCYNVPCVLKRQKSLQEKEI